MIIGGLKEINRVACWDATVGSCFPFMTGKMAIGETIICRYSTLLPPIFTFRRAEESSCVKFYLLITDESDRYGTYTHSRR